MAVRRCTAKAKSTGKRCRKRSPQTFVCPSCKVCRFHGCNCGSNRGAPKGNRNAEKHGIYGAGLRDDEVALWPSIDVAGLDDELRLAKVMLRRAVIAQANRDDAVLTLAKIEAGEDIVELALELTRVEFGPTEEAEEGAAAVAVVKKVLEGRDFWNEIHRFLGRIERLAATRATIGGNAGVDAHATAVMIQEALAEIETATHGEADE